MSTILPFKRLISQPSVSLRSLLHPRRLLRERRLRIQGIEPKDFYIYSLSWLTRIPFDLVLDIGAARGGHTLLFHHLFPQAEIHAFEPLPESLIQLRSKTVALQRIVVHPIALSDQNGKASLHIGGTGYDDSSSLFPMTDDHLRLFPGSGSDEVLKIETHRLDDVLDSSRYQNIFVKMDVQGAEPLVLRGGERMFAAASVVVTEVSFCRLYEGCPLFDEIYEMLRPFGFVFRGMLDQVHDRLGERKIIQGDAIFIRM
jgi:FkbM family methyltransferase